MFYELWDLESGNMIGDYDTEAEALVVVRDIVDANTPSFADLLSLGCTADDGSFRIVAQGRPLAVLADRFVKQQLQPSADTPATANPRARRLA